MKPSSDVPINICAVGSVGVEVRSEQAFEWVVEDMLRIDCLTMGERRMFGISHSIF